MGLCFPSEVPTSEVPGTAHALPVMEIPSEVPGTAHALPASSVVGIPSEVPGTAHALPASAVVGIPSEVPGTAHGLPASAVVGIPSEVPGTFSWKLGMTWLYVLGVAVMLARLLLGWAAVRALRRHSTPMNDAGLRTLMADILGRRAATTELRMAPTLDVPACFGWRRPVIFLPSACSSWGAEKQKAVLAHECHHIRRADSLSQTLALVNRSLYWFHPLAWWLPKHLSQLAERASDAGAVRISASPQHYARYLLEVAALVTPSKRPTLVHSMAGRHDLEVRVRALLDRRAVHGDSSPRWTFAWTAVLCLAVMGVAASELVPGETLSAPTPTVSAVRDLGPASTPPAFPASPIEAVETEASVDPTVSPVAWTESRSGISPSRFSTSGVSSSGVSPAILALDSTPQPTLRLASLEALQQPEPMRRRQDVTAQATVPSNRRQVIVLFDDKHRVSSLRRSWRHRSWDLIVPALNQDLMQWFEVALESNDRVAVLSHHGRQLRLHQDLTTEPRRWAKALDEVARWQGQPSAAAADKGGPSLDAVLEALRGRGGSSLEQALVDLAAAIGQLPGQTSVVLVSSRFVGDRVSMEGDDVRLRPSRFDAGHQRILDAFARHRTPIQLLDPWRVGKRGMRSQPLFPSTAPDLADVPSADPSPSSV